MGGWGTADAVGPITSGINAVAQWSGLHDVMAHIGAP